MLWRSLTAGAERPIRRDRLARRNHLSHSKRSQHDTARLPDHYDLIVLGAGSGGYVPAIRGAQLRINHPGERAVGVMPGHPATLQPH
jgi:hypothetical protein